MENIELTEAPPPPPLLIAPPLDSPDDDDDDDKPLLLLLLFPDPTAKDDIELDGNPEAMERKS